MANASAVPFHLAGKRIFVAGHNGMAGSAIVRRLRQERTAAARFGPFKARNARGTVARDPDRIEGSRRTE